MIVNSLTKRVKRWRTEAKKMKDAGFERIEADWRIHRGGLMDHVITDVAISCDGKWLYYKLGKEHKTDVEDGAGK
jgi:hypothetical protein